MKETARLVLDETNMSESIIQSADDVEGTELQNEQIIFWNGEGRIVPHLLFEYFASIGIGNYFPDDSNKKNSEPILIKMSGNVVSPVNVGYLLDITKNYILERTQENGDSGPILDSLHGKISLFSDKNLKLLPTLKLEFITDTADSAYFFFKNGIVKVSGDRLQICNYDQFDQYVWEKNIVQIDFETIELDELEENCDFMKFFKDLTFVDDTEKSTTRLKALSSAVGYLIHRYKDPSTTKAIILMDVYVNGMPNGGSGKTLLINSIGKIRNLSIIDGKKYDQKEWFGLSSVELNTDLLLFDDVERNFDFEMIFPLMSTGMLLRRKYRNNVFVPFEKAPKVAITTNYAINGNSSSYRRRMWEFEISATYSADFSPRDKFSKNFFDDWNDKEWNYFFNTMFLFLQIFQKEGLVESDPINMQYTKLINKTCEEFVEWADRIIHLSIQYDKKYLYDGFMGAFPEFGHRVKQREFTSWLKFWGQFKKLHVSESHSDEIRHIMFSTNSTT